MMTQFGFALLFRDERAELRAERQNFPEMERGKGYYLQADWQLNHDWSATISVKDSVPFICRQNDGTWILFDVRDLCKV